MKKLFIINLILLCGIIFYSCESNDNPVVQERPNQNVPTTKVLVELFTNTSCVPCVVANNYLNAVNDLQGITINDTNVIIIRFHTTLFAGDPFYLYNETDNNARMSYYPNSAIVNPRTFLLGAFLGNFASAAWTNKINEKLSQTRSFSITMSNNYDTVSRNGTLNYSITQLSGSAYTDLVYHIAVIENKIPYNAPNGETIFENTFRDFITPSNGQSMIISTGQTNNYVQNYSIDNAINQDNTDIIIFVQVLSTKEVLAVEKVALR